MFTITDEIRDFENGLPIDSNRSIDISDEKGHVYTIIGTVVEVLNDEGDIADYERELKIDGVDGTFDCMESVIDYLNMMTR